MATFPLVINGATVPGAEVLAWPVSRLERKSAPIDLPGAHGVLDQSVGSTGGEPRFKARTFTLTVRERCAKPEDQLGLRLQQWAGRTVTAQMPTHPNGWFTGVVDVFEKRFTPNTVVYDIVMQANPWYFDAAVTTISVTPANGGKAFTLTPTGFTVAPLVTTTATVTITVGTAQWSVPVVKDRVLPGLLLRPGSPVSGTVSGSSGTCSFSWRGGVLL